MLRAVLVDDELPAREELAALLAEIPEISIVGTCSNALQAIRTVQAARPDVLFLDINMPGLTGLQLLAMLDADEMPCVVFVTAYHDFALDAFENGAIDYLVKPVEPARLARAIERIKRFLGDGGRPAAPDLAIERIPCLSGHNIKLIHVDDVECVRSSEAGVFIASAKGEFLTELTLTVLEAKSPNLVRCHRQYLVNLAHIDEIVRQDPSAAYLKTHSGRLVPVSRRFLTPIKAKLGI